MPRVLVIDDSPLVVNAMSDALERAGYEVATALDGETGLERAAAFSPEVVITDLEMPGVDGQEVLRRIHERSPETPVLILTEHGEVPLVVQAMRDGAFGYMRKGISEGALAAEIDAALQHRAVLEQNKKLQEVTRQYQARLERMVEEKTAEVLELQRRQAQTEKMAALGTLLAGVAHEVNNPLSVITGNVELLGEAIAELGPEPSRDRVQAALAHCRETLQEMGASAERIERLIARLRRLSHPGADRGVSDVEAGLAQVEIFCRKHLIGVAELTRSVADGVQRVALAEDDFVTCVSNLVINACHAVHGRDGKIAIRASRDGDGWLKLVVIDNGPGIDPSHLPHVWDPFFTTKSRGHGMGLGLSLVYQIVTAAGGEARIESEPERGTTVTLKLPAA